MHLKNRYEFQISVMSKEALQRTSRENERLKLIKLIREKEKILVKVLQEVEELQIDLSILKQEYDIKIGRLYLRLDEVNLEILRLKKIEDFLAKGISFFESRKIVDDAFMKRFEKFKEEYRKKEDEEKYFHNRKNISKEEQEDLKRLWRKLVRQFHPDLSTGNEDVMKRINKAYAAKDFEALHSIETDQHVGDLEYSTIADLKCKLENLEKSIENENANLYALRNSEWAILKINIRKAEKNKRDLLKELSKKVLDAIAKSEVELNELKSKYHHE